MRRFLTSCKFQSKMISILISSVTKCRVTLQWNNTFFYIFIDYRGHHRKGVAIYNATSVNFQQKLWFHWTKRSILEHYRELQSRKDLLMAIILPWKKFQLTFSELPPICLCWYYTKMRCSICDIALGPGWYHFYSKWRLLISI